MKYLGHTYTKKLLVIYLKSNFKRASHILSGNSTHGLRDHVLPSHVISSILLHLRIILTAITEELLYATKFFNHFIPIEHA